jgi:hypothetical protein
MKRDMDLVREILLQIEAAIEPPRMSDLELTKIDEQHVQRVAYHMQMLVDEIGFVRGIDASSMDGPDWINLELTWSGNEFLDAIRDPEVWRRTKEGAKKVGGVSIEFAWEMAKAYGKHVIKEKLGLEI